MNIRVERIGRLLRAIETKEKRNPGLDQATSCELSYGELMLAMNGHPAKGELDTLIVAYKGGNLSEQAFEEGLDEFFGDVVVKKFSENGQPFSLTVNALRVKEIGRLSNEQLGM